MGGGRHGVSRKTGAGAVFLGKVFPQPQNPESLIYSYLTVPRYDTPRWWNEGGAVFLETWMRRVGPRAGRL